MNVGSIPALGSILWLYSSVVEQPAHNGSVVGSNPAATTIYKYLIFLNIVVRKGMESKDKKHIIITIVLSVFVYMSFSEYLSHLKDMKNIEAERENRQIIAKLASNKDF